jgi:hypothetical protein
MRWKPRLAPPPWTQLAAVGRHRSLNLSWLILAAVPLLAAIQSYLTVAVPSLAELTLLTPPLLRLYLALALLGIAQAIFAIRCPSIIRDYESFTSWEHDSPEFSHDWHRLVHERGIVHADSILEELKRQYHDTRAASNASRPAARLILAALYGSSSLLVLYTLFRHLLRIFGDSENVRSLVR